MDAPTTSNLNTVTVDDSGVTHVSLYTGQAEVTRRALVTLKAGQNEVKITRLPNLMFQGSLSGEDDKITELRAKLDVLEAEIKTEETRITSENSSESMYGLRVQASVIVFAELDGDVEFILTYALDCATWSAAYNLRVDTQVEDSVATLLYKADIKQSTGESWEGIVLTLHTAKPTDGVTIPMLGSWNISYGSPAKRHSRSFGKDESLSKKKRTRLRDLENESEEEEDMASSYASDVTDQNLDGMGAYDSHISSKGHVNATFQVPGSITIAGDGYSHGVTISELKLNVAITWFSVPKLDTSVFLEAKITNSSEYYLLGGHTNVYADGSFIARSYIGPVNAHESFRQPLGIDPSIRITYHPLSKGTSQSVSSLWSSGSKSTLHTFSQLVTVHNTKSIDIGPQRLRILDNIPVSSDAKVAVKLISPALATSAGPVTSTLNMEKPNAPYSSSHSVCVSTGVTAQWVGAEEVGTVDVATLGKDGKFVWLCGVPPLGKINLHLQWEVSVPVEEGREVRGL
ncbi:hypothetical protein DXG01_015975 [Tephrocybe rancida]|nr:hypothetical protein DXG01_015975 [Tephrocybe rancida]